jgi:diketogulonate reductase-like aldo/keto reductase
VSIINLKYMEDVLTKSGKSLSDIGIGTYGIGGRGHRDIGLKDIRDESVYVPAIIEQLKMGYNFTEISIGYGLGSSALYLAQGIKQSCLSREDLFITNSLYPTDIDNFKVLENDINEMHEVFNTDYFDSTLVTQSLIVKFGYNLVVKKLWDLIEKDKTRFVSLSNANKDIIQRFSDEFGDKLFALETHISFEIRECQDEGIFDLTDKLGIQTIIWRPLRQGKTAMYNWEPLVKLANKYNKTQNQIVLNWMQSLKFKPMVFSTSSEHIKENWDAMNFEMQKEEYDLLTNYRIPNYNPPKINWDNIGKGASIAPLAMGFEDNFGMV